MANAVNDVWRCVLEWQESQERGLIVLHRKVTLVNDTSEDVLGDALSLAFVNLGDDWVFGAMAGIDLPIGEGGWAFSADLKYLDNSFVGHDPEGDPLGVDLDSTILGLGFGYRF